MSLTRDADGGWTLTCAGCAGHLPGVAGLPELLRWAERQGWHLPRLPGTLYPDLAGRHVCSGRKAAAGR